MPRIQGAQFQGGCYLYIEYSYVTHASENYTSVHWVFGIHFGDYYFNATNKSFSMSAGPGSLTGTTTWSEPGNRAWPHGGTNRDYAYASGDVNVWHDGNGNATLNFWGQFNPSSAGGGGTRSVGGTYGLPITQKLPPAPTKPAISEITHNSMKVQFAAQGDGIPSIDSWQIGYGTDPNVVLQFLNSFGVSTVTGLNPGTTYYFWARGHSPIGYGPWSVRSDPVTTLGFPGQLTPPTLTEVKQTSLTATFSGGSDGGTPITAYQIGYSTSPVNNPSTVFTKTSPALITGLPPATTLYFRVRAQNAAGWSSWSAATMVRTVAGARVKVGAIWKEAIPYVRSGGTWRLAAPRAKILGVWKETL